MSYNSNDLFVARNSRSRYQLEQSLRFNDDDSAYFQLNGGTSPTDGKIFTHSVWVKRSEISGNDNNVFGCSPAGTLYNDIKFDSNDRLYYRQYHSSGGASLWTLTTSARYRDPSAWLHIVVAVDTTQATSSDRVKMYVNGAQITQFDSESYPGQNQVPLGAQGNYAVGIGRLTTTFTDYFDGYMAEYHHVDGTAHEPTDFGEYDANGVWRPIKVTGITYGNLGWYLTFDPSAANGIGHDYSGNGNNFTPSGFTTSGTGTDVMSDTPTNNFATLIPINPNYGYQTTTPVDGNLKATFYPVLSPSANPGAPALTNFKIPTTGKWYYEFTVSGSLNHSWGIAARNDGNEVYNTTLGTRAFWGWYHIYQAGYPSNGNGSQIYSPGTGSASGGGSLSSGDVIGMAINFDNNSLTITRNGSSYATITSCNFSSFDYVLPQWGTATNGISGSAILLNAGQRAFEYTVPTDHQSLCTANLPEPTIKDGGKHFNTVLYTGNGGTQSITGVGFQPDFTWIKIRSQATNHVLQDAVRGAFRYLSSNNNLSENTNSQIDFFSSFNSDGFTVKYQASNGFNYWETNLSGNTYAAWNWKAGGTGSSNTAGSITSTVSANPSAGFSIITYTGTGSNGSVGHGLGVQPKFVLFKSRNTSSRNWRVYHHKLVVENPSFPAAGALYLDTNNAADGAHSDFTAASATVLNLSSGAGSLTNESGVTYVAYCFSEVEGYSKFGSYTGNGSSDGPFVALNFRPAWVLIKQTNSTGDWYLLDSTRASYNPAEPQVNPNSSAAETSYTGWGDLLSNGFKVRRTDSAWNGSGSTYIYAAFAENPFGGSNVSPATAR